MQDPPAPSPASMPTPKRDTVLDGLRGVAALVVTFSHFVCAFLPAWLPIYAANPSWIADTPFALLFNGSFPVAIFFVLSGFVIALTSSKLAYPMLLNCGIRYFRLALPACASTIYAWILLKLFASELESARAIIGSPWLAASYGLDLPPFMTAVRDGLVDVFHTGDSAFNNVLWTMKKEFLGSCMIYALYSRPAFRYRLYCLVLGLIATLCVQRFSYTAFFAGALIYETRMRGNHSQYVHACLFLFSLLLGMFTTPFLEHHPALSILNHVPTLVAGDDTMSVWVTLGAIALVYAARHLHFVRKLLMARPAQFLGRISFGLYLTHVPLLYTLFAGMAVSTFLPWSARLVVLFLVYVPVILTMGYIFTRVVDEPSLGALHRLRKWIWPARWLPHQSSPATPPAE
ncbi:acyltransferase family protein [Acetobacter garciniae]|uniref:Acyltransferase n=2 Tax=Acetobacter garciniae TaxID=2817435 RepID=A0A939HRG9_9PROT|nr:acyltransferase [Acetobacter garciniae]MBO1326554.1 acyltransferase [Acetobacter garciniae]